MFKQRVFKLYSLWKLKHWIGRKIVTNKENGQKVKNIILVNLHKCISSKNLFILVKCNIVVESHRNLIPNFLILILQQ